MDTQKQVKEVLARALARIEELEREVAAPRPRAERDIAVVGIGCRFPGGLDGADSFWDALAHGRVAIREAPTDGRWVAPAADGGGCSTAAGYLDDITGFDPLLFGIAPGEALAIDPQHRLALEVAWEALDDAGIAPRSLAGTRTGVFIGIAASGYSDLLAASGSELPGLSGVTGSGDSFAAGRIAYTLGLQGPAVAVDTACSSSLVALHLACLGLRNGEVDYALAGGVHVMASLGGHIALSKGRMLSPTGSCRPFDAQADGMVRGEGCGIVVLRRRADAEQRGERILALIRGSAINQDGASGGITVPNGKAQEAVIEAALRAAAVEPHEIGYVETHGTSTPLGDPIEARALMRSLCPPGKRTSPLRIGAVKANLGHLESASGIAGLIKAVMVLRERSIPPHPKLARLNPQVSWDGVPIEIPRAAVAWESGRRLAGVSSFGASGTNAHVVLEAYEAPAAAPCASAAGPFVLPISASEPAALEALAERYLARLERASDSELADLCHSAGTGRTHLPHRRAVVGASAAELCDQLRQRASAPEPPCAADVHDPRVAWLFTGQGSQYPGMARGLYASEPSFRRAFDRCAAVLEPLLGKSLHDVVAGGDPQLLADTFYTQPALFAVEYALAELWRSWGLEPAVVIGHSLGEYVAACVAGVMSVEDALSLVAARGRSMRELCPSGSMASVRAPVERVRALLNGGGALSIASINGPSHTVVSGDEVAVRRVCEEFAAAGIEARELHVSHAFHSASMEPMLDAFEAAAARITLRAPRVKLISNLSGAVAGDEIATAGYWRKHVREPVRFGDGLAAIAQLGVRRLLEIGPHPVLLGLAAESEIVTGGAFFASLRRNGDDRLQIRKCAAGLFESGCALDWGAISPGRRVPLPSYPFQRRRYWPALRASSEPKRAATRARHPLLGRRLEIAGVDALFEAELCADSPRFLGEHRVFGRVIVPGAALIETALAAARTLPGGERLALARLELSAPIQLEPEQRVALQTSVRGESAGRYLVALDAFASQADGAKWTAHARAELELDAEGPPAPVSLAQVREVVAEPVDVASLYGSGGAGGVEYGDGFRAVRSLFRGPGRALGEVVMHESTAPEIAEYAVHPALLDAALHVFGAFVGTEVEAAVYLPIAVERARIFRHGATRFWSSIELDPAGSVPGKVQCNVSLFGAEGEPIAELRGLALARVEARAFAPQAASDALYELAWQPRALPQPIAADAVPAGGPITCYVLDPGTAEGAALLRSQLEGVRFARIGPADDLRSALRTAIERGSAPDAIALLEPLGPALEAEPAWAQSARLLEAVRAIADVCAAAPPRLVLVTRFAHAIGSHALDSTAAPLVGLWRVLGAEQPDFRALHLDIGELPADALAERLVAELGESATERDVAERAGDRLVCRLVRARESDEAGLQLPAADNFRLAIAERGLLESLVLNPVERRAPGTGEVELRVLAAGLNFRDVLGALGHYAHGLAIPLGCECVGEVVRLGTGVTDLSIGDVVMGLVPESFAAYATTPAAHVVRKPARLSVAEAATVPVAFLTALYGLEHLTELAPGRRVLVHAAAGGVGMAAVQLCRVRGAEVFATASEAKRASVHALGVEHVFDSRSLSFAQAVLDATRSAGVDVVLNALAGDFIPAGLSVLRPGGVFLEMGKAELWDDARVAAVRPGVTYRAFDVGEAGPALIQAMLQELAALFDAGRLEPLPLRCYDLRHASRAFRFMAQAKHVGKLVLVPPAEHAGIERDGTYLVTGGGGALGRHVARWLSDRGAGSIVLVRRSEPGPDDRAWLAELGARGCSVVTHRADVADREQLAQVILQLKAAGARLRGVFHLAGVLDDAPFLEHDADSLARVFAPKVLGARHLDELTRDCELTHFVLFSSMAAVLGPPGQANYAAANASLDGLAHARRAQGRPAVSLNWGPWAGAGMAGAARLSRDLITALEPASALAAMERALALGQAQVGLFLPQWEALLGRAAGDVPALFERWASEPTARAEVPKLLPELQAASDPGQRLAICSEFVAGRVRRLLGFGADMAVDVGQPLRDMGLDSLMSVELRNDLSKATAIRLSATLLFDYPTVRAIAKHLLDRLGLAAPPEAAAAAAEQEQAQNLRAIAELTDAEASVELEAELAELDF